MYPPEYVVYGIVYSPIALQRDKSSSSTRLKGSSAKLKASIRGHLRWGQLVFDDQTALVEIIMVANTKAALGFA